MAEYIDRQALLAHIKDLPTWWADAGGYYGEAQKLPDGLFDPEDIIASIENFPSADVAPVVHGRWDDIPNAYMSVVSKTGAYHGNATTCSVCLEVNPNAFKTNYCPYCGAKMDGGDGE